MIFFHKNVRERLFAEWQRGNLPQSLCLWGPRGIGKRTVMRWLAQMIACLTPGKNGGCGECERCRSVQKGASSDVLIIGGGADEKPITIEQARLARTHLAKSPLYLPCNVVLLIHGDYASIPAQQALLKTIEEPKVNALVIMSAISFSSLLPTIQSRMTPIALSPVASSELKDALRQEGFAAQDQERYSLFARGVPGRIWRQGSVRSNLDDEIEAVQGIADTVGGHYWKIRNAVERYFSLDIEKNHGDTLAQLLMDLRTGEKRVPFDSKLMVPAMRNAYHNGNRELVIDAAATALQAHDTGVL